MFEIFKSYEALGVEPGASLKAIKKAYRDKVKQWHPDRHQNDPVKKAEAEEKLKEINLAFEHIQEYHEKLSKLPPITMAPPAPKPPPAQPKPKPPPSPAPPPKPEAGASPSPSEDSAKSPQDSKPKQTESPKPAEAPRQKPRSSRRPQVIYAAAAGVMLIGIAVGLMFVNRPRNVEEQEEESKTVYLADLKSPAELKSAPAPAQSPQPASGQGQAAILQSLAKSAGASGPGRISVPETRLASRQSGETFRFSPNEEIRPHALKELLKDKLTNEVAVSAPVSYGETPEDHYQRGLRYVSGTAPNYEEAAKWFTLAAEAGHPAAQKSLGYLYASGKGVPENYAEAQKWFRKASAQGNTEASLAGTLASLVKTNALPLSAEPEAPQPQRASTPQDYYERGLRYANGDGVTQDYAEAAKWYRLAADAGNTAAQRSLGYLYGSGKGVPQDYAEAQKWFQKASSRGDADAGLVGAVTSLASTNRDSTSTNVAPAEKKADGSK